MNSPHPVADGGVGRAADAQSQDRGHGSEGVDTWTGTDASVSGYSGEYSDGCDSGRRWRL